MSWEKYELKSLCTEIIDCVNKTAPISSISTEYKMLRTSDIRNGRVNLDNLNCVSHETFEKWTRRGKLQKGDIIFTREAPLGEVGLVKSPDNYFLGQRLVLFRANPQVCDNRFLLYALMYHDNKQAIIGKGVGSTVLHLRVPECEKITINAPELPVQQRIADILSAYDDLIENNRKQIKLLEEAAQRLYKEWFVDLRFPGHEHTKIVDGVPEGWEKKPLSHIANITMGQSPKSEFYNKIGKGLPFHQGVGSYGNRFVKDETYSTSFTRIAEAGSILFSVRAPVGRLNITKNKIVIGRGIAALNHKNGLQSFLFYMLKERFFEDNLVVNGSIFASISKDELLNQEFIIPCEDVMAQYNKVARSIDDKIAALDVQMELLTQARDRLLPKLMNREVEV